MRVLLVTQVNNVKILPAPAIVLDMGLASTRNATVILIGWVTIVKLRNVQIIVTLVENVYAWTTLCYTPRVSKRKVANVRQVGLVPGVQNQPRVKVVTMEHVLKVSVPVILDGKVNIVPRVCVIPPTVTGEENAVAMLLVSLYVAAQKVLVVSNVSM